MTEDKNIWDDSLLIKSYDDSVNLARETLARRIADATNKRENDNKAEAALTPEPEQKPQQDQENVFKVGDFVRATYTDGLDYEGSVISINEESQKCVVRYVGYGNEQEVSVSDLLPSWGNKARVEQVIIAKQAEDDEAQEQEQQQQQQRAKTSKKTVAKEKSIAGGRVAGPSPGLSMPPMPLVPPMFAPTGGNDGEPEQDFVAMLTAWYMSGYYTGLYQGKKESNAKKKTSKK